MSDETVWLTREQMAELFQRDRSVIGKHIKNIFGEGELRKEYLLKGFAMNDELLKKAKEEYHKFKALQDRELSRADKDFIVELDSAEKARTSYKADKES